VLGSRESSPPFPGGLPSDRRSPERRVSINYFEEQRKNARNFRILTMGLAVSVVYDFIWFIMMSQSQDSQDVGDGGKEVWVRKFSLYMAYI